MKITRRIATWAAAGALVAACGTQQDYPVAYTLATVEGGELPFDLGTDRGCRGVLLSGSMELLDDETYASMFQVHQTCGDSIVRMPEMGTRGAYLLQGDSVLFWNSQLESAGRGVRTGDTMRVAGPLHTLIYVRTR